MSQNLISPRKGKWMVMGAAAKQWWRSIVEKINHPDRWIIISGLSLEAP